MWKQTKVTVGEETADQAMVDFAPGRHGPPVVLEWPTPLPLNAEINIGDATYFADDAQACGGKFHIALMPEQRLPAAPEETVPEPPAPKTPTCRGK